MSKRRSNELGAPVPYSRAPQARELYASIGGARNPHLSACTAMSGILTTTLSPGALGPVGVARPNNYGGLNTEVNPAPYYDPRQISIQAPVDTVAGMCISAPSMKHGPAPFVPDCGPGRPRTQYAPQGPIQVEPLVLDLCDTPCQCVQGYPYSLQSMMIEPANILRVRDLLESFNLVRVTPRLRSAAGLCPCALLGGQSQYDGFVDFASQYVDTSVAQVLDPVAEVAKLNMMYVDRVAAGARSLVINQARMNYLRAEGPRAYLTDRPVPTNGVEGSMPDLPDVLPGTGILTSPEDSAFTARAMTDPRTKLSYREAFSCQTGLPVGRNPTMRPEKNMKHCAAGAVAMPSELYRPTATCPAPGSSVIVKPFCL